jgi:L-Lysine epsilon oxidase N-terminal/L-lysine epsilon oxidase C-terminal domain
MSDIDRIVTCAIHPAVGIARLGKSKTEFYLAPEVPGTDAHPENQSFKDANGDTKREAARFRIYGYANDGSVVKEITSADADIIWRVHVANRKAAWYRFEDAFDVPGARNAGRRNDKIKDRESLVLDPGSRKLAAANASASVDANGFDGQTWHLADLFTDKGGRLIVLGGHGVSRSVTNSPPNTFANNDGWLDDTCDGPIRATVKLRNTASTIIEADPAMVAVAPPNFGQGLRAVVTMYDVLVDMFVREFGWELPAKISYWRDIFPIFERLCGLDAVNYGGFLMFGPGSPSNFLDPLLQKKLMDSSDAAKELRERIFGWFRNPRSTSRNASAIPPIYGDLFSPTSNDPQPQWDLAMTPLQYAALERWARGDFTVNPAHKMPVAGRIEEMNLADQPHALDRAPLENILGGPFRPGIELTWTMRLKSMWREPFRLKVVDENVMPRLRWGRVLTPRVALAANGPFSLSGPGTLTCFLGVPWQTDQASCLAGYEFGTFLPLPTFWGTRVPNHVLPEQAYERFMDVKLPMAQRFKHLNLRSAWLRFFSTQIQDRISTMVDEWNDLGIVAPRNAPADAGNFGIGSRLFVETEVVTAFKGSDSTLAQLLTAEDAPSTQIMAAKKVRAAGKARRARPMVSRRRVFDRGEV